MQTFNPAKIFISEELNVSTVTSSHRSSALSLSWQSKDNLGMFDSTVEVYKPRAISTQGKYTL